MMKNVFLISVLLLAVSSCTDRLELLKHALGVRNLASLKRGTNQERWQLSDDPTWNRPLILKDLSKLGLVEAIKPSKKTIKQLLYWVRQAQV